MSFPTTPTTPTTPTVPAEHVILTTVDDEYLYLAGAGGPGFAAMTPDRQRVIASEGGHAAHTRGRAHQLTDEERSRGGRAGGQTTSQDRSHMAEIGSKGGNSAQRSGHAHKLTDEERSRGGQRSRTGKRKHPRRQQQQQQLHVDIPPPDLATLGNIMELIPPSLAGTSPPSAHDMYLQ